MEKVNFTVTDKRTSFHSLAKHDLDVFHYAGKDFIIKDFCHIFNGDGSFICIFGMTKPTYLDNTSEYLFISGDVKSDTIVGCNISYDRYTVFRMFYDTIKSLLGKVI